jgi:phosphoenolpyruvate phosphomutase
VLPEERLGVTRHFREALLGSPADPPIRAVGAVNAVAASIAAEAGFQALWVSSLEVSTACGLPDANVIGIRELTDVVLGVSRAVELPIVVDIDNAGGSVVAAERYAADMLSVGASVLCIEDSRYPKCNSFSEFGRQQLADERLVVAQIERMRQLMADDGLIIGRTESLIAGRDEQAAVRRVRAYVAAGADAVLIHSKDPTGQEALRLARSWDGLAPLVTIPTAFPQLSWDELGRAGYRMCIYANQLLRAAMAAMRSAAEQFFVTGVFESTPAASLATLQDLLGVSNGGVRPGVR